MTLSLVDFLFAVYIWVSFVIKCDGDCLASPPAVSHDPDSGNGDVSWTTVADGIYSTTLWFDKYTKRIEQGTESTAYVEITARYHNDSLPSPTLRMERDNQYLVTLINNLGPESSSNPTDDNVFKDPNTTNIHSYGPFFFFWLWV